MKLRHLLLLVAGLSMAVAGLATPASARASSGHQSFVLLSTKASTNRNKVFAKGPIHATGVDIQGKKDKFKFADGTLIVTHHKMSARNVNDKKNCLFQHFEKGTYKITKGTGAYADVSGHGHYALSVVAVGCSKNKPPKPFQLIIRASGPISF
jgi:hypothetical protein